MLNRKECRVWCGMSTGKHWPLQWWALWAAVPGCSSGPGCSPVSQSSLLDCSPTTQPKQYLLMYNSTTNITLWARGHCWDEVICRMRKNVLSCLFYVHDLNISNFKLRLKQNSTFADHKTKTTLQISAELKGAGRYLFVNSSLRATCYALTGIIWHNVDIKNTI